MWGDAMMPLTRCSLTRCSCARGKHWRCAVGPCCHQLMPADVYGGLLVSRTGASSGRHAALHCSGVNMSTSACQPPLNRTLVTCRPPYTPVSRQYAKQIRGIAAQHTLCTLHLHATLQSLPRQTYCRLQSPYRHIQDKTTQDRTAQEQDIILTSPADQVRKHRSPLKYAPSYSRTLLCRVDSQGLQAHASTAHRSKTRPATRVPSRAEYTPRARAVKPATAASSLSESPSREEAPEPRCLHSAPES